MSQTAVSICSNALISLGDSPISSFDEASFSDRARLAANLYEPVRDYVLRSHPWNCAIKRVQLAPMATRPAFEYGYQFLLPGDFLRVLSVGLEGERPRYKVEGKRILLDWNACLLRYIWRNEDPATWDAMLVWGMTAAMRAVLSYPTNQSTNHEQIVDQALKDLLKRARAVDASEDEPDALDDSPLLLARHIGSRYR